MDSQDRARKRLADFQEAKGDLRAVEKQKVAETGKTPYFHTTGEIRKKVLEKKFTALKKSGKVEAEIAKRRKHDAAKEKKAFIPMQRRFAIGENE